MDLFFFYITWFGSILVLLPAGAALIALFRKALAFSDMILLMGGLLGASLLAHILKILFARPRPTVVTDMMVNMPPDFSFPSAHTAQAAAFFVALGLVASRALPGKPGAAVWLLCGLLICSVGLSRIYLKVHYVSDVIAGAALGVVWVLILNWFIHLLFPGGGHA
jgi:undecaprenyl-diphosphatase